MKILTKLTTSLILASALIPVSFVNAADNFQQAKPQLEAIFKQLNQPKTLYCGCNIVFPVSGWYRPELNSCGYKIQEDKRRARRIEAEHIMPAWDFGRNLKCWKDAEKGEGRIMCEAQDKIFNKMEGDLHNLYPAVGEVNKLRSNYGFTEVMFKPDIVSFGDCGMAISSQEQMALPPVRARGIIARAYLYMSYQYKIPIDRNHMELYQKWDEDFAPDSNECKRNELIGKIQGNTNPFTDYRCQLREQH